MWLKSKFEKCGEAWVAVKSARDDLWADAYDSNHGLYTTLSADLNLVNHAWRNCL